ncbi:hypothetical protein M1P56_03520 [Streptomyces sp. HU2014]|uniref:Secreted protein n=1 Tax=Streptomyces albireticuli TaxID=1940 RepID=A0A1Z2L6H7_9ACTN|nr:MULTISPECIES: hypothetical protein [Streptomyces]ARZ69917.1 hypothetical protein SMD11_4311 [Streptomyces albireticuli]UQI43510.1 hypothetical protein M1P56_03520 [Streptomyces sp. HU2014]
MADRAESRRARPRTVVAVFAAVTAVAFGGVWFSQAQDRASAVSDAPKTAAAQKSKAPRGVGEAKVDAAPAKTPGVRECGLGEPVVEPEIITLTCADAGMVASGITWAHYALDGAEGNGVVQVSRGANGAGVTSFPARFRLYGAKNVDGKMAFTGLEVDYTGATPLGESRETYSIA